MLVAAVQKGFVVTSTITAVAVGFVAVVAFFAFFKLAVPTDRSIFGFAASVAAVAVALVSVVASFALFDDAITANGAIIGERVG